MIEFHDAWIFKSQNDLRLVEVAIRQDDPILDGAIFHAQQCAEKALKGFLAYHRSEIRKTHNLVELIDLCAAFDPAFNSFTSDARYLTPKATEFRYIDDFDEIDDISQLVPTIEEVEEAIVKAKRILDFVKSKLPKWQSSDSAFHG
jgi:HEPN domain-containing protein